MNLNPFDLPGPEFLAFYLVLSAITLALVWKALSQSESGEAGEEVNAGAIVAKDPYQVAFLRGGRDEVLRVAVVSLLERGLLLAKGKNLVAQDSQAADKTRRPLDRAILTKCAAETKAQSLCTDTVVLAEATVVREPLRMLRLVPDTAVSALRAAVALMAIAFLVAIAGTKITVALQRGHTNILFLIIFSAAASIGVVVLTRQPRTSLGNKTRDYLKKFFAGLASRNTSFHLGKTTSELTYLAAVFGVTALPVKVAGMVKSLNLNRPQSGGVGGSCGSGSSGGGGCGGGGCGGGCGGCG